MAEKKAYRIKRLSGFKGEAWLYRLNPPMPYDWEGEEFTEYVVSSAVVAPFTGPETYLFPAGPSGKVLDWGELEGSYRGGLNCDQAVRNAGYAIVEQGADSEG